MIDRKKAATPAPPGAVGAADAIFLGWQSRRGGESIALYNITARGHPSAGSTVTEEGLRDLHLRVPSTPRFREPARWSKSFEKEALAHTALLHNFALRMTRNREDADDLVQETYLKAYRFWDKYEEGTNIRGWLCRILKNSYINRYRREKKEPDAVDYDQIQNLYESIRPEASDSIDEEVSLFGHLLDDDVACAVSRLPGDYQTAVILCDLEGWTYEQAAQFMACPIGTVRSRLHRGRNVLRTALHHYAKKNGYPA